uniref:Uncharacterized protein n=1 Tax=Oryza nivara TaxID=4536 RepID=A0A0E0IJL4_ORYNI
MPPSSSPHDGADKLANGVASLAAAGSPNLAMGATTQWIRTRPRRRRPAPPTTARTSSPRARARRILRRGTAVATDLTTTRKTAKRWRGVATTTAADLARRRRPQRDGDLG